MMAPLPQVLILKRRREVSGGRRELRLAVDAVRLCVAALRLSLATLPENGPPPPLCQRRLSLPVPIKHSHWLTMWLPINHSHWLIMTNEGRRRATQNSGTGGNSWVSNRISHCQVIKLGPHCCQR